MVANQADIDRTPMSLLLDSASLMESAAAKGEWAYAERLARELKRALLDIPESERRHLIALLSDSLLLVQTMALSSRNEIKAKLTEIRRGKVATRAYGQPAESVLR